jgi:hypothetical protein
MSSVNHKRVWDAPVATALSIRSTAATMGPGSDVFLLRDFAYGPSASPIAPLAEVGALPVPSETVKAGETDQRTWEGPAVTTLAI